MLAVYPGTFDPITLGHLDIVERASRLFPKVLLAIAASHKKRPLFTLEERVLMACACVREKNLTNVEVVGFSGLTVDLLRQHGSHILIRCARAVSDFEYEFQMAGINKQMMPEIETLFLMPSDRFQFLTATFVREAALFGGDVSAYVTPLVREALEKKRQERSAQDQ